MPQVSLTCQQVFGFEAAIVRNFQLVQRQCHKSGLRVVRVEIHNRHKQVGAIIRLLAVANELIVISVVELQRPVILQSRILVANFVHARNQVAQAVGPVEVPVSDLVLLGVQVFFAAVLDGPIFLQLKRRAVDSVVGAERRRQQQADHKSRADRPSAEIRSGYPAYSATGSA